MSVPSRAEVQAAAQRVLAELDKPTLAERVAAGETIGRFLPPSDYGFAEWKADCRILAEAALRRVPPAPRDPRADYAGDEFPPSGPFREPTSPPPETRFRSRCADPVLSTVRITPASEVGASRYGCGDDEFPTAGV